MQKNTEEIQPLDPELGDQFLIDHMVNFLPADQLEEVLQKCSSRIETIDARVKKLCELGTTIDKSLQLQLSKLGSEKTELKTLQKSINISIMKRQT